MDDAEFVASCQSAYAASTTRASADGEFRAVEKGVLYLIVMLCLIFVYYPVLAATGL